MNESQEIIGLARNGETLKKLARTGWALAGVDCVRQESVGEHSYGTVLISALITKALVQQGEQVDISKVVTMAALHDLAESITSDIPRTAIDLGGIAFENGKRESEKKAIQHISKKSKLFGEWLLEIWNELEKKISIETRIVLGADIIDMLVHAVSLETSGVSPRILDQFFTSSYTSLKELKLDLVEDIFWNLYNEHHDNASKIGVKIEPIPQH